MNKFKNLILAILILFVQKVFSQNRQKLPNPINTPTSIEYAPSVTADGKTLIYQSDQYGIYINANKKVPKIDADGRTNQIIDEFETNFFGVYEVKIHPSGEYMPPKNIEPINQYANENMTPVMGGPSISYDGNTLFFFANFGKNGYGREDIYYSTREKNGWGKPENIGSVINTDGYEGFPSVSPDGKRLYFTREVLGKKINDKQVYRIMVSEKGRNGKWKMPFELPPPVNTNAEKAPRIMADSKTLIFSRIKAGSKTDFDLYKSTLQNDGSWSEPITLDFINTNKSDLFVSMSPCGDLMYFVSNGDIYTTEVPQSLRPIKSAIVQGFIVDAITKEPLNAKLIVKDNASSEIVAVLDNNPFDGRYTALLTAGNDFSISVNLPNYYAKSVDVFVENQNNCKPIFIDFDLKKLPTNADEIVASAATITSDKIEKTGTPTKDNNEIVVTGSPVQTPKTEVPSPVNNNGNSIFVKNKPIEEVELVADNATTTSEKISKEGEKIKDEKVISQLALILAIVNKETGEYITTPNFTITKENGEPKNITNEKNGNEYYFRVDPSDAFKIVISAPGFLPFLANIPAMVADRKITIKMAPSLPSYLNINLTDAENGKPLNGKAVIYSKETKDSVRINIIDGKARYLLTKNAELIVIGRAENYSDLSQIINVNIPENGSKTFDLDLKLVSNQYILEMVATDIETGKAIPNAVFHVFDSKGIKILDVLADENGKITRKLPKLDVYSVKCLAEGFKEQEQQITDLKHNTKVLFKSVANKKRIHQIKVLVYDALTKEEIHPEATLNGVSKGKSPFFADGEEGALFEVLLAGDGVKPTPYKFAFNDSLIHKVNTILYAKKALYDFYFKALNKKTRDLVKSATFKIIDSQTKQEVQKISPDGMFMANLDIDKNYILSISAPDYQPFEEKISSFKWVQDEEYERSFYIEPIIKIAEPIKPNIVKSETFGDIEKGKSITLKNIYFDQSSPVLRTESFPELDQLIKLLQENPTIKILIKGHTDNAGDYKLNVKLSQDRCEEVIAYLVKNKIDKNRLKAEGKGPDEPISPNTTEESRRKNRRVEFVVL